MEEKRAERERESEAKQGNVKSVGGEEERRSALNGDGEGRAVRARCAAHVVGILYELV
jgi:hypothetical protein